MADFSSVFSGGGPTFNPSTFGGGGGMSSYPTSYEGVGGITPIGGSFGTPSFDYNPTFESKFDTQGAKRPGWENLLKMILGASPGIEKAILRMRGFPESEGSSYAMPRMAGDALAKLLQGSGQGDNLSGTLSSAAEGIANNFSDFGVGKMFG